MSTVSCANLSMKLFELETHLWVISLNISLISFFFVFSSFFISGIFWRASNVLIFSFLFSIVLIFGSTF